MRIRFNLVGSEAMAEEQILMKKIEYAQVKKQVEVLASFLPDEILKLNREELNEPQDYVGVLLFADVSGFTQLTEKYNKTGKGGIYRLTATLNAYIGAIVEVLRFYGGDVLKFSGDAFLALWKVMSDESLFEILHAVVVCALVIQQTLGHFETEVNVELKVKLAISCGNMTFSVIGNSHTKHYLIAGEAINDVKAAEHVSVPGDVVISPGAWAHMLQERYEVTMAPNENIKVWSILYKPNETETKVFFHSKQLQALKLTESHINHRNALHAKKRFNSNLSDSKITENFINSLPRRFQMKSAPKHWIVEDLRPFIIKPVQELVDESQPVEYLTEMRDITIQFINIVPENAQDNLIDLVDRAFQIITSIAGDALGVVNKVSLFDKDVMILVLFGLRAINHEMESQNALRSAYKTRNEIVKLKHVTHVSIGITNGFVYCGVVGHPMRREYSVIGAAVNKAARIMCAYMDKVTCDHKTFRRSKLSSYYFQLQTVVKLKGIEEVGNIFEYNENFDTSSHLNVTRLPIVGVSMEMDYIKQLVKSDKNRDYQGVCFCGVEQSGKTKILQMSLNSLKKSSCKVASVALEGSGLIPYFCISKLYRQLYDQITLISDDDVKLINLPRELWTPHEAILNNFEDIALQKYRTLNYFRDLIRTCQKCPVLLIDNIEYIDQQSWEILDLVIVDRYVKLITTMGTDDKHSDFKSKLEANGLIKLVDVRPIPDKYVSVIACQMLSIYGIPLELVRLLQRACDGRPGYIQSCLLRLVNNGSLELEFITKNDDMKNYIFPPEELLGVTNGLIRPVARFSEKYNKTFDDLTLATISLDLFDSFTPYQQLVIKTGAVLGDLFTRTLLKVALKYPSEIILAKVIEQLFREEIFECGARYIYAMDLENSYEICCRCYFENFDNTTSLPNYAYCKILRFKNKSIRDVAYDLLPNNQRTELHLLCTDLLENINNKCPNCLRYPINNYINFGKFKQLMMYCNNTGITHEVNSEDEEDEFSKAKDCIRKCIKDSSCDRHKKKELVDLYKASRSRILHTVASKEIRKPNKKRNYSEVDIQTEENSLEINNKTGTECSSTDIQTDDSSTKTSIENKDENSSHNSDYKSNNEAKNLNKKIDQVYFQSSTDPKLCNCFDILARVYKDLIYHSHSAGHVAKQVFFTLKYGLMLILMKDYINAIIVLTEARELCFNESVIENTSLSGVFKKVMIGKIEIGLAKAYLEIRQLRATKNHLAIALRQYNIPSVSLNYKHFSHLLTRSFLVNTRRVKPFLYKNSVTRSDLAACLNTCTMLFILEGNWKMTKLTSAYSLYLMRTLNNKAELLCETYCSAIDIARYTENFHVCQKLQKFAIRDLQSNYAYNLTYNMYSLNILLVNILEITSASGDICKAIRIGYRVLDISLKIPAIVTVSRIVATVGNLLLYNCRIIDFGNICNLLRSDDTFSSNVINLVVYHRMNLILYRRTGFLLCPIDETIDFATNYFMTRVSYNWEEFSFMTAIYVHFLMLGNIQRAEDWKHSLAFNSINIKRKVVFLTLLWSLEANILLYMRSNRLKHVSLRIQEKVIYKLMQMLYKELNNYKLQIPAYYCIKSWLLMLQKKKRAAFKLLKKVEKVCVEQENYLYYAFAMQLKNAWNGGFYYPYHSRPALDYKASMGFSVPEMAQYISPYPLEY